MSSPVEAMHAGSPTGFNCADCTIDKEPCIICYTAWWKNRHPNAVQTQPTVAEFYEEQIKLTEIARDEYGRLLWSEPYIFRRLSGVGEVMVRDYIHYTVISCKREGNIILTVCRAGNTSKTDRDTFWQVIIKIGDAIRKLLPYHPDYGVRQAQKSNSPAEILINIDSLGRYFRGYEKSHKLLMALVYELDNGKDNAVWKAAYKSIMRAQVHLGVEEGTDWREKFNKSETKNEG